MAAYRMALAEDKQSCIDSQAEVNAIGEQREAFAETPWIPAELKEIFEVVLGCDGYPEHPEDVYRPPATSNPQQPAHIGTYAPPASQTYCRLWAGGFSATESGVGGFFSVGRVNERRGRWNVVS
jgi:hypothetical protein